MSTSRSPSRRPLLLKLRRAALRALEAHGLSGARMSFIAHSENATYRVEAGGERLLLRLHLPHHPGAVCAGTQTEAAICSELQWLAALRGAGLPVPEPVADRSGALVQSVSVSGEAVPVLVTLMRWIPGRFPATLTPEHLRRAGRLMARMHRQAEAWTPPPSFHRPVWDHASFERSLSELEARVQDAPPGLAITREHVAVFRASAERIRETTAGAESARDQWGLIHADLHPGNLLFHGALAQGGEARAIDFSRCGYGHFAYDIAECCRFVSRDHRRAFAEGYSEVRPLPEPFPELLEAFFIRGWIEGCSFHAPNPAEQEWLREVVPPIVERLAKTYLRGEPYILR